MKTQKENAALGLFFVWEAFPASSWSSQEAKKFTSFFKTLKEPEK